MASTGSAPMMKGSDKKNAWSQHLIYSSDYSSDHPRSSETIPKRYKPSSLQFKFWALCGVVLLMCVVYGVVFWDSLIQTPRTRTKVYNKEWDRSQKHFDLHLEDHKFGHAWEEEDHFLLQSASQKGTRSNSIALGCAITTRNYKDLSMENLQFRLPLLRTLIPSFCNTASAGFDYHFYISFDIDDTNLIHSDFLNAVYSHFEKARNSLCTKESNISLHFVQCSHSHNPAWAQNDAMMEAYLDNIEYYYRVNDDTLMLSPGWTETYIEALQSFNPPYVGVVGPVHRGGNEFILTYDFVHKTHVDIFGYYYPRLFTDWWADDWITAVYGEERTIKLPGVRLKHTQEAGQRYQVQYNNGELVHYQVAYDRRTLNRYISSKEAKQGFMNATSHKKVISMSLWGNDPKYTFGAVRNAQIAPVFFPGWTLRVYVEAKRGDHPPRYDPPPQRVIRKLENLGAEIIHVDTEEVSLAPMLWRFLVADDMSVESFIVRDCDARLSDRDAIVVDEWLKTSNPFHCVRDHPSHSSYTLSGGLWGARPKELQKIIPIPWKELMMGYGNRYGLDMTFLNNLVWRKVQDVVYCHDSYTCKTWPGSHPFPLKRRGTEHVGQVFDAFGYARDEDMKIIRDTPEVAECSVSNGTYVLPGEQPGAPVVEAINSEQLKQLEQSIEKRNMHNHMEDVLKESLGESKFSVKSNINRDETEYPNTHKELGDHPVDTIAKTGIEPISNLQARNSHIIGPKEHVIWSMEFDINSIRYIEYLLHSQNITFIIKNISAIHTGSNTCRMDSPLTTGNQNLDVKNYLAINEENPSFQVVSHFLCSDLTGICELYANFLKPFVLYLTSSSVTSIVSPNQLLKWINSLKMFASETENVIIADSHYIAKYVKYHTGLEPTVISPVCSYVKSKYRPSKPVILLAENLNPSFHTLLKGYLDSMLKSSGNSPLVVYSIPDLYPACHHSDLSAHPAVIYIPHEVSSYNFCEIYHMNIPIFAPSLHLLASWHLKYKVMRSLNKMTLNGNPKSESAQGLANPDNLQSVNELKAWLQYMDIYQHPHIIYFDSVRDLARKLSNTNLSHVSSMMEKYSEKQEMIAREEWLLVLQ